MMPRTRHDAGVAEGNDAPGALTWQVRDRGWAARIRLTSYPDRKRGKLDYAVARAPKGIDEDALARVLDAAEWRTQQVSLPRSMSDRVGIDHADLPKLVARVFSEPLSNHQRAQLTLTCLAIDEPPVMFETEIGCVRAAETVDALECAYIALLSALAENGSTSPADDARLCFGLCYATELRKRQDWQADLESRI